MSFMKQNQVGKNRLRYKFLLKLVICVLIQWSMSYFATSYDSVESVLVCHVFNILQMMLYFFTHFGFVIIGCGHFIRTEQSGR